MPVPVEVGFVRLAFCDQEGGRFFHECDAQFLRPRRGLKSGVKMPVDVRMVRTAGRFDLEGFDELPIQEHFHVVRFVEAFDFFVPVAGQADADFILPGLREGVRNQRSAPRAQRQTGNVGFLRLVRPDANRPPLGTLAGGSHREPADFLRGRDVAVQ